MRPVALAADPSGDLYVGDNASNRVFRIGASGSIRVVAGTGQAGFSGDGGPAVLAMLNGPFGLAVGANGDLYISDTLNNRVRRISAASGIITTVAGNGRPGFGGDFNGPATEAQLQSPVGLATDKQGGFYVADKGNFCVRYVDAGGRIRTYAGGSGFYTAHGLPPYLGFDLLHPEHIALDGRGNLYISVPQEFVFGTGRMIEVTPSGKVTIFSQPADLNTQNVPAGYYAGLAVDQKDQVIAAEYRNLANETTTGGDNYSSRLLVRLGANGLRTILAGNPTFGVGFSGDNGPALTARFTATDLALDSSGNIFIADWLNYRVRKISASSGVITTFAGTEQNIGPLTPAVFSGVIVVDPNPKLQANSRIAADAEGNIFFVADQTRIRKMNPAGAVTTVLGPGITLDGSGKPLVEPAGVVGSMTTDGLGNLLIGITANGNPSTPNGVYRLSRDGVLTLIGGQGAGVMPPNGTPAIQAQLGPPAGIDGNGTVLATGPAAFLGNGGIASFAVFSISSTGLLTRVAFGGSQSLSSLYSAPEPATTFSMDLNSTASTYVGGGRANGTYFALAANVFHIASDGNLYGVSVIPFQGTVTTDTEGNLFVSEGTQWDKPAHRIRIFPANGGSCLVAGTGSAGLGGDGGPALQAEFNTPVALASAGDLVYVLDGGNMRFRKLTPVPSVAANPVQPATGISGSNFAPGQVIVINGSALANTLALAAAPPYPTFVSGTRVTLLSGDGSSRDLPLVYVSPTQLQALLPADVPVGVSNLSITTPFSSSAVTVPVTVQAVAPSLFAADGTGIGLASGTMTRTNPDGSTYTQPIAVCGGVPRSCGPAVLDLGVNPSPIVLTLQAAGLHNYGDLSSIQASVGSIQTTIMSVTASNQAGVDLLSLTFDSSSLAGLGQQPVTVTINGVASNTVLVDFGGRGTWQTLGAPLGLATDIAGNLYVSDTSTNSVQQLRPTQIVATLAGNGSAGFFKDQVLAFGAELNAPGGVAVDAAGLVYVADTQNNRIRRIRADGTIETFAGLGGAGYFGENVPAQQSVLNAPSGLVFDGQGNLYVADSANRRIRRIESTGNIRTVAGNGVAGSAGDEGPAVQAQLNITSGVALRSDGALVIADAGGGSVRYVGSDGIMHLLAGPAAGLIQPVAVATDSNGNVYVADARAHQVFLISAAGAAIVFAGTGTPGYSGDGAAASSAQLNAPMGVLVDGSGAVVIADTGNGLVRRVASDGTISTIMGVVKGH
jgi:uncharacterized protein (TIGR03437 family)